MTTISVDNNGEFTFTIVDLIKEMSKLEKFAIKIWTNNSELPFLYDHECEFHFLQESIKVIRKQRITYIALDNIVAITLMRGKSIKDVAL